MTGLKLALEPQAPQGGKREPMQADLGQQGALQMPADGAPQARWRPEARAMESRAVLSAAICRSPNAFVTGFRARSHGLWTRSAHAKSGAPPQKGITSPTS